MIEPGDYFGMALAAADFNRDSYTDLAIGAPGETIYRGEIMHAGVIHVAMGSESGLTGVNDDLIWQDDPEGSGDGAPETGDYFGSVLAVGNFNCDDFADLAVGIPFEDTTDADAGAIQIIYGGVSGMGVVSGDNLFTRDRLTPGVGDPGDHFGWALAAGDFDSQGCDDLAIGVPDVDFATVNAVGVVYVMDGQPDGLSPLDYQGLAQAPFGLGGEMEADDRLGYSLAAGNFNGDNFADLAIGVPYEDADHNTPQTHDAGAIHVVYGGLHGLNGSGSQYLYEGAPNIGGIAEADDRYGETLAAVINGYWWRAFLPLTID